MLLHCGVLLLYWIPAVSLQNFRFTIEPQSVIVRQGSPAILNCQTNIQTSDVIIQWRKGYGTPWIFDYDNKPYKLLGNYSLYFSSVGRGDEDVYFCAAHRRSTNKNIYSKVPAHITLAYINSNFIRPPLPTTVREHQTATLTCISGASQPLPSVAWEKNGRPITKQNSMAQNQLPGQNATSGTFHLRNVSLSDAGHYRCVAINPLLTDQPRKSQQVLLLVLPKDDRPRIEVHPVNMVSPINHPLRLDCVIVGVPSPVVFWLHNDVTVKNTSNRVVYPNGSLVIHSLTRQDNGQYSCNGTNSKGSVASSKIFLTVAYVDFHFVQDPFDQTVVNGSRVEMVCEPPSHFPRHLRYKWYHEYRTMNTIGGRVSLTASGNLVIAPVLKSDEGTYFCEVTNEFRQTRTSKPAYLTVNVPPYFLTTPSDQTVILGATLHLTCDATGYPKPLLKWYHGNALLSNTSRVTLGADGSLVLKMVIINDAGQYRCSVENVAGNNFAVAIVVVHAPPNGTIMPSNTSAVLGNNATFLCRFSGNPPPVTIWYFKRTNGRAERLARNVARYIQTNETLTVVNVTENDNGVFVCVGENVVGAQNFSATLRILVPAHVVKFARNGTVNESDVAEMTCAGYGIPQPTVTWSLKGNTLTNSSRVTVVRGNLRIGDVSRNDAGLYSCTVENYLGKEMSSAYLTVQVSPTIERLLGPSRVEWKQNVTFHCKSYGVPIPRITWLKDMRNIPHTTRIYAGDSVLNITSVGHNDTGNYTCEASNVVGSARMTRELIVEVPPSQPLNVRFGMITSTSMEVLWRPGFNGYSPITSYKLEIRQNSTLPWSTVSEQIKSEKFTVSSLRPYTVYHVRVFAENKIGMSEGSASVWNRTGEDSPSSPLRFHCKTINASTIFLSWDKPSRPNGNIRKYRIQYGNHSNRVLRDVTVASMGYHVHELRPFKWYKFRVQAATGGRPLLWGNYTSYVKCRSGEAAPMVAPRNFSLISSSSESLLAKWQKIPTGSENGVVTSYYIRFKKTTEESYTTISTLGNDTFQYKITGLAPWTFYVVQVAVMTVALGPWSVNGTSRTLQSAPSGRPNKVTVKALTSSSFSVAWEPPLPRLQNGIIRGYTVLYYVRDSQEAKWNLTTNETSVELSGLMIFTSYVVRVRAFTHAGDGPYSDGVVRKTLESYPSSVTNLRHKIVNDSVLVTWQPPLTPNGVILAYTTYLNTTTVQKVRRAGTNITMYNVTSNTHEMTSHVTQVVLTVFYGNVTYTLCVAARTSVGHGPCSNRIVFTTNFTKKLMSKEEKHTSSIIDDHLPLIAAGAAVLFVAIIVVSLCVVLRRRNKEKEEKETKQTFNFQRHTFSMRPFDDGDSSVASHGSKPIHAYSVESSSIHSRTNPSCALASEQSEGNDGSPTMRLRNNSLALGSDASSYDAPYSTVAEIGVDPSSVTTSPQPTGEPPRHFVNTLYTERELEDSKGETGSQGSYAQLNPRYEPMDRSNMYTNYPQQPYAESVTSPHDDLQGGEESYPEGEGPLAPYAYEVLVLPPPPPEYSDHSEATDETSYTYSNAVTDF